MKLVYKNKEIEASYTHNPQIMRNRVMKLYFAFYLINCNKYSSIKNRYRIDIIMVDKDNIIVGYKQDMHINTVYNNNLAQNTIITPVGYFNNIKIGEKIEIKE